MSNTPLATFTLPRTACGYSGPAGVAAFPFRLEIRKAPCGGVEVTAYHDPDAPEDDWLREYADAQVARMRA